MSEGTLEFLHFLSAESPGGVRQGLPRGSIVRSFLGLPYRILNVNHKKELFWSLWVGFRVVISEGSGLQLVWNSVFFGRSGFCELGRHANP